MSVTEVLGLVDSRIARIKAGKSLEEEAAELQGSLRLFLRAAWPHAGIGRLFIDTWHVDAIADHLMAAYRRELPRLLITIQPGMVKSWMVSVIAPAWRWTTAPEEQIISASHTDSLATRDTRRTRTLIATTWYQARWGDRVQLLRDENLKTRYTNTAGGYRVATHVGGGTGERGGVLILDDPHNANDANATSENALMNASEWIGNTWSSRLNATNDDPGVKIVIGQRVHEKDVMGFLLTGDEDAGRWTHLCLPTRYDPKHPFVYPDKVYTAAGTELHGDERTVEGALLAPLVQGEDRLAEMQQDMTERTKAAQYQQNPTPREGAILKRADWRYYPRAYATDAGRHQLPPMRLMINSWDTSFKAKVTSDKVAGVCGGVSLRRDEHGKIVGADHYLLRSRNERLSLQETKDAMKEMRQWTLERWPRVPLYVVIEKSANGVEIIEQLQREIDGVIAFTASVDKKLRAEAASPALESHNVFVPGEGKPDGSGPDPSRTDAWVMAAIEQCAKFTGTGNEEDDWVDAFTQLINWARTKDLKPSTVQAPPPTARITIGGIGGGGRTGVNVRPGR